MSGISLNANDARLTYSQNAGDYKIGIASAAGTWTSPRLGDIATRDYIDTSYSLKQQAYRYPEMTPEVNTFVNMMKSRETSFCNSVGICTAFGEKFKSYITKELPEIDISLFGNELHFRYKNMTLASTYINMVTFQNINISPTYMITQGDERNVICESEADFAEVAQILRLIQGTVAAAESLQAKLSEQLKVFDAV